jgi:hypothetical protein
LPINELARNLARCRRSNRLQIRRAFVHIADAVARELAPRLYAPQTELLPEAFKQNHLRKIYVSERLRRYFAPACVR